MDNADDDFLSELISEGEGLLTGDREAAELAAALEKMKERQRVGWQSFKPSAERYLSFLAKRGRGSPDLEALLHGSAAAVPPASPTMVAGVRRRVGEKRKAVLEAFAQFTADGIAATTRAVADTTGVGMQLAGNVIIEDRDRGHLQRVSDGVHVMTEKGFEFLRAVGSPKGDLKPAETKTPNDLLDRSGQ